MIFYCFVKHSEDIGMDCKLRAKNCGGCPMLATEYAAQLKKKEADVRALLGKYGPVAPIRGDGNPLPLPQ